MALNDFPDAWISCLMPLLAQTYNCLVIPALSLQSLSPGFFLLLSLKNTYKILSRAAWFCSYVIFSQAVCHPLQPHTHSPQRLNTCLPGSVSIPLPLHTHTLPGWLLPKQHLLIGSFSPDAVVTEEMLRFSCDSVCQRYSCFKFIFFSKKSLEFWVFISLPYSFTHPLTLGRQMWV